MKFVRIKTKCRDVGMLLRTFLALYHQRLFADVMQTLYLNANIMLLATWLLYSKNAHFSVCSLLVCFCTTDLCTAPPDKSARRGTHGTEHGAYTWWTASIGQAASASKPVANDQGRNGADPQPGAVTSQSRATSRTRSHSGHCPAADEGTPGYTTAGLCHH